MANEIQNLCVQAREASRTLAKLSKSQINHGLACIAKSLQKHREKIDIANQRDIEASQANGLSEALLQRLHLGDSPFSRMLEGIEQIIQLPYPIGEILREWTRPNGLLLRKIRIPIGVIGIIYESRPNVTIDAAVLCLKTNNAVVLRGGSEAFHTNQALAQALHEGALQSDLPPHAVQLLPTTDREAISLLCQQENNVDLLIPRGGEGLIRAVTSQAKMPVIKHYHGVCHLYIHSEANFDMAEKIVLNAKCQKPGVCNSLETLLVDKKIAPSLLPRLINSLHNRGVEIRADASTQAHTSLKLSPATEADWTAEYLDLILSIKVVKNIEEAMDHIHRYGSHHSDGIITRNTGVAESFLQQVDSAAVLWNASTRFHDGMEFGFGAEMGISTDKLHARGPMALEELTSYKYLVIGDGQIRT